MPPKLRPILQFPDDLAWEKSDEAYDAWQETILGNSPLMHKIGDFILKHKPGKAVQLHVPIKGSYNICYRLEYADGSSVAFRVPVKGPVRFPYEKVKYEVATMRFVAAHTTIPVPKVYHYGTAAENPTGMGPFIILDYVNHACTLFEAMQDPAPEAGKSGQLNPNISDDRLSFFYRQMANIVAQLSALEFPRIGSLVEDEEGSISVRGRPMTQNMNTLVDHASVPASLLPAGTYSTADECYSALADMHLTQLVFQHNDAVDDEDDARDKYVARQLFRQLAAEGRLSTGLGGGGSKNDDAWSDPGEASFRLFSEDLRPSNVLVDKYDRIVAVIDWEWAYVAPSQFAFDPPWWLLLAEPDWWDDGLKQWIVEYGPRLELFLRVLEEEEEKLAGAAVRAGKTLAQRMRRRWETKSWMINWAARKSWTLDSLFWRYLDPVFFGPNEEGDHKVRLGLLTPSQLEAMEPFVVRKIEEAKERVLVDWEDDKAAAHLAKVLV